jgi:serine/threonine-protein kinase
MAFIVGAAALLATLGVLVWLVIQLMGGGGGPDQVQVPNVAGMAQNAALERLRDDGLFGFPEQQNSDTVQPGFVIGTDPPAGELVDPSSNVTVYVSAGQLLVEVPDVTGLTLTEARIALEADGFVVGEVTTDNDPEVEPELIISQTPAGNTDAPEGSTVDLVVSIGPGAEPIPDVLDQPEADARRALEDAGFEVDTVTEYSDDVALGNVIRTEPGATEEAEPGSTVLMVVSDGPEPVAVPNLFGLTEDEARAALADLRLELVVSPATVPVDDVGMVGKVVQQDPAEGVELLPEEGQVTVSLASLRQIEVPDLTGLTETEASDALDELGLVLNVEDVSQIVDDENLDGKVVLQDPADGEILNPGDTVTVRLGEYRPPDTTSP